VNCVTSAAGKKPGSVPGGTRPLRSHEEACCTHERASERKTGFNFLAPPPWRLKLESSGRRLRTWTHSSTEGSVESVHAVEFSKTVAPLRERVSFPAVRPGPEQGSRGGPISIARRRVRWEGPPRSSETRKHRWCSIAPARGSRRPRCLDRRQDRTCTVTVRVRGRSSKSISTSCCQVPSASRPSTSGTVSDGPITAARRCAWAFVSWLRRLCS
jgi:hypothetical protein